LGTARDGLRPLEATPPAASLGSRRSAAKMKRATRQTPDRTVGAFQARPHDEISPERHRQRLGTPAYIRQRIDDLCGTLIRTVAKTAQF
jgi:hypothetical protein